MIAPLLFKILVDMGENNINQGKKTNSGLKSLNSLKCKKVRRSSQEFAGVRRSSSETRSAKNISKILRKILPPFHGFQAV